ncbi:hypothetical protein Hanom_Chr09g00794011 [Helianthus anomalus]
MTIQGLSHNPPRVQEAILNIDLSLEQLKQAHNRQLSIIPNSSMVTWRNVKVGRSEPGLWGPVEKKKQEEEPLTR